MTPTQFYEKHLSGDLLSKEQAIELLALYRDYLTKQPFTPPTHEEVAAFFVSKTGGTHQDGLTFAEKFIAHYELKNWKYGNKQLKDWKRAAIAAWDMNKFVTIKTQGNGTFGKGTSAQGLADLIRKAGEVS